MTMDKIMVTAANLEAVREEMPASDQAASLQAGCETWGLMQDSQRGQITVWPNGRGAICFGGDSEWGEWQDGSLVTDDGYVYDAAGACTEIR